ncbi:CPXCG motif-containing cysteine-rich protein [Halomonas cupida]|uniref:CPXCG motif-containing cysteine-rich protein n=1 Tax=Halomonas cupida TaxID=44933 RepID=UPI0039B4D53F
MNEEQLPARVVNCPYCDAHFSMLVDPSQGSHESWEDCPQCCAPIHFKVAVSALTGEIESLVVGADDDVI